MNRLCENCLTAIIILTAIGVVQLHFIVRNGRLIKDPCTRSIGVHWVRDPKSCSEYYICVTGLPVKMPPCPKKYVWSVAGRNCVPEVSHWNDCPMDLLNQHLEQQEQHRANDGAVAFHNPSKTNFSATSDRMDALMNQADPNEVRINKIKSVFPNHPCVFSREEVLLPHPKNCHWYFNCSLNASSEVWVYQEPLTEECQYPRLFSLTSRKCEKYDTVDCGSRNIKKEPCEYRKNMCTKAHCRPCNIRFGSCVGKKNGNHSFPQREWTPRYIICKDERTVDQRDCADKTPIFSPASKHCEALHNIPKEHGGLQPACTGRHDGFHPDETGRCDYFFECRNNKFVDFATCGNGRLFDPRKRQCSDDAAPPCGNNSALLCRDHQDGMYADAYGRCPMYYHCKGERLLGYLKCPFGSFSPKTGQCEMSEDLPAPCGKQENLCFKKPDGAYPDLKKNCMSYFRCSRNFTILMKTCAVGFVFNHVTGKCDDVNNTPPPCGMAPSCFGRKDGRYPSPLKGCQYFYKCSDGLFRGYEKCSLATGGFYFNQYSQKCDFPKNICGPCGFKKIDCGGNRFSV
ncbi:uncharacterized protein LOC124147048 isoform X2 [Haliotis rufescens]|uniref:uncharacterized protein LOC124147048 isoform X2 n=1 Tax=Haliotis rufescens TaxID=6454 RepID=UPI001EAFE433|nr:uncharacterized protein LOC124147048 isoform X2 [Haliotis rufescens]